MTRLDQMKLLDQLLEQGNLHLILEDLAHLCYERKVKAHKAEKDARDHDAALDVLKRLHKNSVYWENQNVLFEVAAERAQHNLIDHEKTPG